MHAEKKNRNLEAIRKDEKFRILGAIISGLRKKYKLDSNEILSLIEEEPVQEILIPNSIFDNEELSCLETIVKYLKEELKLRLHEIALLLNRNDRTIWTTYKIACKKRREKLPLKESKFHIPASIFTDRKFSIFELVVSYLKENFNLRYCEIAALLNRDERNVWAVYNKAKKKQK